MEARIGVLLKSLQPPIFKRGDNMIKGNIHSIETMGLVDGPGIRVVIFFSRMCS